MMLGCLLVKASITLLRCVLQLDHSSSTASNVTNMQHSSSSTASNVTNMQHSSSPTFHKQQGSISSFPQLTFVSNLCLLSPIFFFFFSTKEWVLYKQSKEPRPIRRFISMLCVLLEPL